MFVKLNGAEKYGYKGALFDKGVPAEVEDTVGDYLLTQADENGIPYFKQVLKVGGGKMASAKAAEKAKPKKVVEPAPTFVDANEEDSGDSGTAVT